MRDEKALGYARQVLAAAIVSRQGRDALARLTADDMPTDAARLTAEAIRSMDASGTAVDVMTLAAEMDARGTLRRVGGSAALHELANELITAANVNYYATLLRGETRVRMATAAAERVRAAFASGEVTSPEQVWDIRDAEEAKIPAPFDEERADYSLAAFMRSVDSDTKWIVPGLVARGERIVLTGGEGLGKGVLLRQLAATAASGWHPFGSGRYQPARVLYVDLENPRPAIKETFWTCGRALAWDYAGIQMRYEPDGIDLLGGGTAWLHQIVGDYAPDLLVIGPAYKAIGDADERDGVIISRLLRRIDQVRRRHDVAVLIEQHSPHEQPGQQRTVRPVGSSMWRRWADAGIGIRPHDMTHEDEAAKEIAATEERSSWVDVIRWKPPRGQRDWPRQLKYGTRNELPWIPAGQYETRAKELVA